MSDFPSGSIKEFILCIDADSPEMVDLIFEKMMNFVYYEIRHKVYTEGWVIWEEGVSDDHRDKIFKKGDTVQFELNGRVGAVALSPPLPILDKNDTPS